MKAALSLTCLLLVFATSVLTKGSDSIIGTWQRVSTTQSGKPVGSGISWWLTFTPDHHFFQVTTPRLGARPARRKPDRELTKEELVEQYGGVEARFGTYRVEANTLVRRSYLHSNPNREGERVIQSFHVRSDTLILVGPAADFEARFVRGAPATPRPCAPVTFVRPPARYAAAVAQARASLCERLMPEMPGIQVAVAVDGQLIWSEAHGEADLERHLPVTRMTQFRIGSISKPITVDALALLVQDGKLDLDAPIQRYLPSFPAKRWPITVRQLAGHLAGIRGYIDDEAENHSNVHYPTVTSGLAIFANDSLLFEPGTHFSYSTYGYSLLSAALEGAAGQDFPSLVEARVLTPLGMRHTMVDRRDRVSLALAKAYDPDSVSEGFIPSAPVDNSYKWAGGGYLSTAEDLVAFGSAHLKEGRLTNASLRLLFTSMSTSDGKPTGYDAGWYITHDAAAHEVVSHSGSAIGGSSMLSVDRGSGVVFAMCVNLTGTPDVGEMIAPLWGEIPSYFEAAAASPTRSSPRRGRRS